MGRVWLLIRFLDFWSIFVRILACDTIFGFFGRFLASWTIFVIWVDFWLLGQVLAIGLILGRVLAFRSIFCRFLAFGWVLAFGSIFGRVLAFRSSISY